MTIRQKKYKLNVQIIRNKVINMAIHVTRRELKIKTRLLAALVIILGTTSLLFLIFCKGKGYSQVAISMPPPETSAEISTEPLTEKPTEPVSDIDGESEAKSEPESESESESKSYISWDSYDPLSVLAGDDWMLTLINSSHPIGKGYTPTLAPVIEGSSVTADSRVADAYKKMYDAAKAQDIILAPYAGYVSYSRQQENYNNKVNKFITDQGMTEEEAKQSASTRVDEPGASESGAGLSVDIISASAGFASTKEYDWLMKNAHKYGFVLRYPEEKFAVTGMAARPWHWRYVGVDAANEMKNQNLCLEEYLEKAR